MRYLIDPGHGGYDSGAVGNFSREKDLNLEIAKYVFAFLKHQDENVQMTRTGDYYPSWSHRVKSDFDDVFISIHCNANKDKTITGSSVLYYPGSEDGKRLAELVQDNLVSRLDSRDIGIIERDDLYVLKGTKCPAILVETGFMSNEEEEKKLNDIEYQIKAAEAIVDGVIDF